MNAFKVVRDFEAALCQYTGAIHAVTTTSCTMALLLAVAWHLRQPRARAAQAGDLTMRRTWLDSVTVLDDEPLPIEIPKRTYIGVPMSIVHAGGRPTFRDENWGADGYYQLKPLPVYDAARWFSKGMYFGERFFERGSMVCVSFHWNKTLGIQQGGAILLDDPKADEWLRRARFDGRREGIAPSEDTFDMLGWHAYMAPETAAAGLVRLAALPAKNAPLAPDPYPDLSQLPIFK